MSDSPHDRERIDALLERLLASGGDPAERPAPDELARDPELEAELAELRDVARRLDAVADDPRAILAAARGAERPSDRADVAAALDRARHLERARHEEPAGASRGRGRRIALVATATAAGLVALLFVTRELGNGSRSTVPDARDHELGGASLELLAPVGPVDPGGSFGPFRWRFELPPGGHFEVRVYDRGAPDGASLRPTITSERLTEPEWTPTTTAAWPDAIRWEVVARDASGAIAASSSAFASRSD